MGKAVLYYILVIAIGAFVCFYVYNKNSHFNNTYDVNTINEVDLNEEIPHCSMLGYQSKYAVPPAKFDLKAGQFQNDCYAAILIDDTAREPIVAYNAYRRIYPASTTKLMTALVVCDALDQGKISLDEVVTLDYTPDVSEPGAVRSFLHAGDSITIRNLLYGLLMKSYNDYAVILANYVGGSYDTFIEMMNTKAYQIGATNSHFANPHGLHDDNHYVTAYDMYLIEKEASKYDVIKEIDACKSFSYTYVNSADVTVTDDISPTNLFLSGNFSLPSNITILDWKTGTTDLAGNIMCMRIKIDKKEYSMFVADAKSPDDLYNKLSIMFNLTSK